MSNAPQVLFPFRTLGQLDIQIGDSKYTIDVDICAHGARFATTFPVYIEVPEGQTTPIIHRTLRFGEGHWLSLPTIEQAVLEDLKGTFEDVEEVSKKYDGILQFHMPEFLANPEYFKGFILQEYERLKDGESAV